MVDVLTLSDASVRPRIAWQSVLEDATISSPSSVDADGAVEQVADWTCYTFWRPMGAGPHVITAELDGAQTVSGWAISGHDASGLVGMDTWNGSAWVLFAEVVAAGDGLVVYLTGTPVVTTKLRFRFAAISHLCILWAGVDVVLPEGVGPGWEDPQLGLRPELSPEVSRDGVWLGAAITQWNLTQSLELKHVDATWARDYWTPFLRRCCIQPFFLHWNSVEWPASAVLCTNAKFGKSAFSSQGLVDLSVNFDLDPGTDRRMTPVDDAPALLLEDPSGGPLLLE